MSMRRVLGVVCALSLLVAAGVLAAAAKKPHEAAIARQLVDEVARVKPGDKVLITGDVADLGLTEELELAVMQRNAFPLSLLGREAWWRRYFKEVPASYDSTSDAWWNALAENADVVISVDKSQDPSLLKDVPPERVTERAKKYDAATKRLLARSVRQVSLGNGLFPTPATAKSFGLSLPQLEALFWAGVHTDYKALQARGAAVRAALEGASQLRLQHANGTDLSLGIAGRPVQVSDGVLDEQDLKKGGATLQTWLPAGEVYLTPVPGTAKGTIVFDRLPYMGSALEQFKIVVDKGAIVSMDAKPGAAFDNFKARYAKAEAGKELLGVFDLGINPDVTIPKGSRMVSYVPSGSVTVMFGGNAWAGGDNPCPFGFGGFLSGGTVTLDGKPLVDKGALALP